MMTWTLKACGVAAVAMTLGVASAGMAAPRVAPLASGASGDFTQAQYRPDRMRGDRWGPGGARMGDRGPRDRGMVGRELRRDRFEHRRGAYFYNGHRGYRDRRDGYRLYNGWWFPPAAFGLMLQSAPGARVDANAHVAWCQDRWKSYRASDNSYQPYNGPRQPCVSPYGG